MLEVKIVRTYADRSVTKGLLIVDGKQIGHTMEKPQQSGAFGKCLDVGAYHGKIVCTQYSPFTIKVTCCGRRFDSCLIPQGDYEKNNARYLHRAQRSEQPLCTEGLRQGFQSTREGIAKSHL